jgi:hypothetical protein
MTTTRTKGSTRTRTVAGGTAKRRGAALPARGRAKAAPAETPVVIVAVKELDPQRKCGLGTTVQFLYRVDESVGGRSTPHLVFYDRHGWYCEHGRACPAVMHAKKRNGQIARVS